MRKVWKPIAAFVVVFLIGVGAFIFDPTEQKSTNNSAPTQTQDNNPFGDMK